MRNSLLAAVIAAALSAGAVLADDDRSTEDEVALRRGDAGPAASAAAGDERVGMADIGYVGVQVRRAGPYGLLGAPGRDARGRNARVYRAIGSHVPADLAPPLEAPPVAVIVRPGRDARRPRRRD